MMVIEEDRALKITCSYCRGVNEEDEHRCQRCGRRLLATASQGQGAAYMSAAPFSSAATAPALRPVPAPPREMPAMAEAVAPPETAAAEPPRRVAFQRSLFSMREAPQV